MPPKKDGNGPETAIAGFDNKETRLLAAAFVSYIGPDKVCLPTSSCPCCRHMCDSLINAH